MKTRFFLFIERILALFTDRIIALSQSQLEELSGRYRVAPREKFVVIPLGLELSPFLEVERQKGRLRRELGLSSDTLLVGIMGRFAPIKNHRMLLDTIALLRARSQKPIAKFIFIGDGELREELEDYARGLGIGKDVVFLGWRSDLDNIYADLDIVALCSKNEGTPTAIIEAMAAGKAVVATDSGGVSGLISGGIRALSPVSGRFLIGERGLVVGNGDREGFACALMELAHNVNLRRELGEKARAHAKQVYTKERLIRDMEGLYVDLLSVFRI